VHDAPHPVFGDHPGEVTNSAPDEPGIDRHNFDQHSLDQHSLDQHSFDQQLHNGSDHSRRDVRAARQHRRRKRRRSRLTLFVTTLVVTAAVAGAWFGLRPLLTGSSSPDDYPGPGTGQVQVVIEPGDSGAAIAQRLVEAGVILSAKHFVDESKTDSRAAKIQPGTYDLQKQMSASEAIAILSDPANRVVTKVTVREGLRATEVVDLLVKQGYDRAALDKALADPNAIGLPPEAKGKAEGWLFPATYQFEPGTSAAAVLSTMVSRTQSELADAGVDPADVNKVLTTASIVQAEGGSVADYAKISRVIANRIQTGQPLQMDSTVSYATQTFNRDTTAAQRASTSPYNTYRGKGLPPGPIDNPGRAAIDAALNPEPGPWLFFVTVDPQTGDTRFAVTAAEHAKNVALYQAWAKAHPTG